LASVVAVTNCRVLRIAGDAFRRLLRTVPGLASDLKRVAASRLPGG
jgi:CRP-like cAMP-binding protein